MNHNYQKEIIILNSLISSQKSHAEAQRHKIIYRTRMTRITLILTDYFIIYF